MGQPPRSCLVGALLLLGWLPTAATPAGTANYGYPLENPLAATIIGTPAAYRAQLPDRRGMRVRELRLSAGPRPVDQCTHSCPGK